MAAVWVPEDSLAEGEGPLAPYQRVAQGQPLDPGAAARLAEGGDALWRVAVAAGLLSQRMPPGMVFDIPRAPLRHLPDLPPDAVAIGVVDGPLPFAHRRFRLACGASRLDWLWLLDQRCGGAAGEAPFGCERVGAEVSALLASHAIPGGVDEETLYRAVGPLDMAGPYARDLARAATHGGAVLGLAAGGPAEPRPAEPRPAEPRAADPATPAPGDGVMGRAVDARPEAFPLMAAALPAALLGDTSGAFTALHVVLALDRMLRRAAAIGQARDRPLPVVVSISLGLSGGPKDGSGLLERYIDGIADALAAKAIRGLGPCHFVLPLGNERQARLNARLDAPLGPHAQPLWWRLPPDDGTHSFLEIWGPLQTRPGACPLTLGLQPPGAAAPVLLDRPALDQVYALGPADDPAGGRIARAFVQWLPADPATLRGDGRVRILIAAPPTRPDPDADGACPPCAPPGDWRLTLTEPGGDPARFRCDLYVQRDDTLDVDRPRGRQSRLVDPAWRSFDDSGRPPMEDDPGARVRRSGSINAYATARTARLAGGRWGRGGAEVPYSSPGDGRPVSFAVTDDSRARPGVRVIGARSGGVARYAGASMAAPVVARDLAAQLSADLRA